MIKLFIWVVVAAAPGVQFSDWRSAGEYANAQACHAAGDILSLKHTCIDYYGRKVN
jgi:hypothetical protein